VRQIDENRNKSIQINYQLDAPTSQVYYLTFMYRSTCFGRLHAHHQELTTALAASGFSLERGGSSVVGRGLSDQVVVWQTTTNNTATTTFQEKTRGC
jgi:hypothetical protein